MSFVSVQSDTQPIPEPALSLLVPGRKEFTLPTSVVDGLIVALPICPLLILWTSNVPALLVNRELPCLSIGKSVSICFSITLVRHSGHAQAMFNFYEQDDGPETWLACGQWLAEPLFQFNSMIQGDVYTILCVNDLFSVWVARLRNVTP